MTNEKLLDDIRTLGLEVKKVELENQLAQLKAEQAIDEGLETIVKKQNQILLHIKAELEFIKQHLFDPVLINGSIKNIFNMINGQTNPPIDEACVGCCKVIDVAAKLQKELDEAHGILVSKDRVIVNLHKTILDMDVTISDLMDNDRRINGFLDEYRVTVDNRDNTIKELKDQNIDDLKEMYDFHEGELEWFEDKLSARKEDSAVLMKVVEIVGGLMLDSALPKDIRAIRSMKRVENTIKDYLDAPEVSEDTTIDEPQEITVTFAFLERP